MACLCLDVIPSLIRLKLPSLRMPAWNSGASQCEVRPLCLPALARPDGPLWPIAPVSVTVTCQHRALTAGQRESCRPAGVREFSTANNLSIRPAGCCLMRPYGAPKLQSIPRREKKKKKKKLSWAEATQQLQIMWMGCEAKRALKKHDKRFHNNEQYQPKCNPLNSQKP